MKKKRKRKEKIWKNSLVTPHDGGRVWDPRPRPDGRRSDVPFLLLNKVKVQPQEKHQHQVRHFVKIDKNSDRRNSESKRKKYASEEIRISDQWGLKFSEKFVLLITPSTAAGCGPAAGWPRLRPDGPACGRICLLYTSPSPRD